MGKREIWMWILMIAAAAAVTTALLQGVDTEMLGTGCAALAAVFMICSNASARKEQKSETEKRDV